MSILISYAINFFTHFGHNGVILTCQIKLNILSDTLRQELKNFGLDFATKKLEREQIMIYL